MKFSGQHDTVEWQDIYSMKLGKVDVLRCYLGAKGPVNQVTGCIEGYATEP